MILHSHDFVQSIIFFNFLCFALPKQQLQPCQSPPNPASTYLTGIKQRLEYNLFGYTGVS